jgi:hypothetical protein
MSLADRGTHLRIPLLPEFIHPSIPFNVSHWSAAGRMCGVTAGTTGAEAGLSAYRAAHYQDLVSAYGPGAIHKWMPR